MAMRSLIELYQEQIEDAREQGERRLEAQQELEAAAAAAAEQHAQAAQAQADAEDGDGFSFKDLQAALPMIAQVMPMLRNMAANAPK